jgi:glutathionyl-hydroquinone reductase
VQRANHRLIPQHAPVLSELYQLPYVQKAVNLRHIKEHYFSSHAVLNPYSVVPKGPDVIGQLLEPHDRARFDE